MSLTVFLCILLAASLLTNLFLAYAYTSERRDYSEVCLQSTREALKVGRDTYKEMLNAAIEDAAQLQGVEHAKISKD